MKTFQNILELSKIDIKNKNRSTPLFQEKKKEKRRNIWIKYY